MGNAAKILIVEDEYITSKIISKFLKISGYDIAGCAMNVDEAIVLLANNQVDLVILDINLNDERDGIWLANYIKEKYNIPYLFLTAYTDKSTMSVAIKTSPYGFLAKPFQKTELFATIEIALHKQNELSILKDGQKLLVREENQSVFLKNVDRLDKVYFKDICFIESQKNYLLVYTKSVIYKHRITIKEFTLIIPPLLFIKTHRAFFVNIKKIDSFDKIQNTLKILGKTIPVSNTYKQEIIKLFKNK